MAENDINLDAFRDLLDEAGLVGILVREEKTFHDAYAAFRAGNAKDFQAILKKLEIITKCSLVCEWIRSKECVFLCLDLCGVPKPADQAADPRLLAEAIVRITSDSKVTEELADALDQRNRDVFQRIVTQYKLGPLCHFFCHWLCIVRYRLICRWVCGIHETERPSLAVELQAAGESIGQLLAHKDSFDQAVAAAGARDSAKLAAVIKGAQLALRCHFICEWFCSWRCTLVCLTLCREFPLEPVNDQVAEALAFGKAIHSLTQNAGAVQRLIAAVTLGDSRVWPAILKELKLERFCTQICHWVCSVLCRRLCVLVCPPLAYHPWFTHVGDFSVTADIDPVSGLTNKAEAGHGGPHYGFFGCLKLRGFCPKVDPTNPGDAMAYRFLYRPLSSAVPAPITGGFVCEVLVGSRYTLWHGNPATLQSVRIRGTGTTSPTPPISTPAPAPPDHYIVPDAEGWINVDQNALDGGFDGWLSGFSSGIAFPGGAPLPGVPAGTPVPVANQKLGVDAAIIFQATRVSTIAAVNAGGSPDYTNELARIHINNWNEVSLINLTEFAGGMSCSPVTNNLHIQFTTDHELMANWYIDLVTAATVAPPPVFPSGVGPRGSAGTDFHDTTTWPSCSYLLRLHTRRSLTDGLLDDPDKWEGSFLTFCIEH
jgi:hypothetical protein